MGGVSRGEGVGPRSSHGIEIARGSRDLSENSLRESEKSAPSGGGGGRARGAIRQRSARDYERVNVGRARLPAHDLRAEFGNPAPLRPYTPPRKDLAMRTRARNRWTARRAAPDIHCSPNLRRNRGYRRWFSMRLGETVFQRPDDFPDERLWTSSPLFSLDIVKDVNRTNEERQRS